MAASGMSGPQLMAVAGHTSMETTKRYLNLAGVVFTDEAARHADRVLGAN
jgi:hypothetical protein